MFRTILIGTALTLVGASTSFTPVIAKSIPHNYADPCKTALENYKQAQWERTHLTDKGNLGGAEGWDELADAAEKNAKTSGDRVKELKENAERAKASPSQSDFWNNRAAADTDFWNGQAEIAEQEARDWKTRAGEHRTKAEEMRKDAKEYEEAAAKALKECWTLLTFGTVHGLPGYRDITINGKPLKANSETTETTELDRILLDIEDILTIDKPLTKTQPETTETTETEKKPGKKPIRKTQNEEKKKPKPVKVKKAPSASQQAAQSFVRDVAVSAASQLIFGEINGMGNGGHKHKKHHKADRHQKKEGHAMKEGKSRRKMKRNKRMSSMF